MFGFPIQASDYQIARAGIATLFNAALLANPAFESNNIESLADMAIEAADMILGKLNISDPDGS